ncbi:Protein involved in plasmid maintenance/nuclear protein involved in lipid metabolism, partial [Trachipleistophora hominis]
VVKDRQGELRSTKFYVCFDQSHFNSSVYLIVNGVVTDIVMEVDEMGHCFFQVDYEGGDGVVDGKNGGNEFGSVNKDLSKMEKTINYCNVGINGTGKDGDHGKDRSASEKGMTNKNGVDSKSSANQILNTTNKSSANKILNTTSKSSANKILEITNQAENNQLAIKTGTAKNTSSMDDAMLALHKKIQMRMNENNILEDNQCANNALDFKLEDEEKCIMTDSEDDLRLLRRRTANPHFLSQNFKLSSSKLIVNKFLKESEIARTTNLIYRTYAMRYLKNRETFYERGGDVLGEFLKSKEHYDYLEESAERLFLIMARRLGTDRCTSTDNADAGAPDMRINGFAGKKGSFNAAHETGGDASGTRECACTKAYTNRVITYHSPYLLYGRKTGSDRAAGNFKFSVKYSLCADKKIAFSIEKLFTDHSVKNYVHSPNLVVRLSDGHVSFYMPSELFAELFMFCLDDRASFTKFKEFMREKMGRKNVHKRRTRNLSSHDLHKLHLQCGRNTLEYKLAGVDRRIEVSVYLWNESDKVIVSDIDGTITKSDLWGHIYDLVGKDWTHGGVAALFTKIVNNNYRIIYLSNRAMPMYFRTRRYLSKIKQNGCTLPDGPIVLSPKSVLSSLYTEVRNQSHIFKIDCLQQIERLFCGRRPFFAGFGNRISDLLSYKVLGIAKSMIFIIDRDGSICEGMKRKVSASYLTLNHFANTIFPEIKKEEDKKKKMYHDFYFWRL